MAAGVASGPLGRPDVCSVTRMGATSAELVLVASVLIRLGALGYSLRLSYRIRDARMLFLSAMLALMALRQTLTLLGRGAVDASAELPGLVVSGLALTAVFLLGRMLQEMRDSERALSSSEAHFRHLIESSLDAVVVLDHDGRILYCNPTVRQQIGHSAEALRGRVALEIVVTEDKREVAETFARAIEQPGTPQEVTCRIHDDAQAERTVATRGVCVHGPAGELHVLLSVRDVTAAYKAERERSQLQAQLYQAQKMETLGTLAGGIAHDFNNILTPIMGSAELAQAGLPKDHPTRGHLEHILDASERARALVHRMLLIGRKARMVKEPHDMVEIVEQTLELIRVSLPSSIKLRTEFGAKVMVVDADAVQLQQVVLNLCANAAQAMPEGGELRVELLETDGAAPASEGSGSPQGPSICLRVSDTGHGMSEETKERIFEPFFSTKQALEGSGLGLSVVHGIVDGHGGTIGVRSALGEGTRFEVRLPRSAALPRRASAERAKLPRGGGTLLLVDDEPPVLSVNTQLLRSAGYEVEAYADPQEALSRFSEKPGSYLAVITDFSMPELNGLQLAERLRTIRAGTPIVLITGFAESSVLSNSAAGRVDGVLEKPFRRDQLLRALQDAAGARSSTAERRHGEAAGGSN